MVQGAGCKVLRLRAQALARRIQGSGCRVYRFRVQGSTRSEVQGV